MLIDDSFNKYGEIAEHRVRMGELKLPEREHKLALGDRVMFFRFPVKTLWNYKDGMSALLIKEGDSLIRFYLDRAIYIKQDVEFGFVPIGGDSIICSGLTETLDFGSRDYMTSVEELPEIISRGDSFRFYMAFNQSAPNGIYFRGESHEPIELVYVKNGSLNVFCEGRSHNLTSGDIVLIQGGSWHMMYSEESVRFCTITFIWDITTEGELFSGIIPAREESCRIIDEILKEGASPKEDSRDYQGALLKLLILQLKRNSLKLKSPGEHEGVNRLPDSGKRILNRAVKLVSENLSRGYTVDGLARDLGVSRAYITRLFKDNVGMPPAKYITLMRLEECKTLLESSGVRIGQVASQMGYSNIHHFSRQFTQWMGVSPRQYALRGLQNNNKSKKED